jgi:hypothetical protein
MTMPAIPEHVDLIVTHGGCHDGFTAEWLLSLRWPNARCHQAAYGEDISELRQLGADIAGGEDFRPSVLVMADFSYGIHEMFKLAAAWDRVILLDHHATAAKALDGNLADNVETVFDLDRSGAGLVADWLGFRGPGLGLVDYVEDRDLWRHVTPDALPDSLAISAVIGATPHTHEAWFALNQRIISPPQHGGGARPVYERLVEDGNLLLAYRQVLIDEIVAEARPMRIGDYDVPVVPCPYNLGSDVAGALAAASPDGIGGYYRDLPDRREFGLRSTDDGPDVAEIAASLGGGGHPHASGFRVNRFLS